MLAPFPLAYDHSTGILDQEGAQLIAINGEKDTIFPIGEFSKHSTPKVDLIAACR